MHNQPLTQRAEAFRQARPLLARLRNSTFPSQQQRLVAKIRSDLDQLPLVVNAEYHLASLIEANRVHRRSFSERTPALTH